jgi:hypothetical protein
MIRDHVWRAMVPPRVGTSQRDTRCQFMNCRQPRTAHERVVSRWSK